ncbi:MAG TPA: AI-2E family transporter [Pseudobdellovibrionaceae bacterium]|jgi:predicted PurR-regulated permease PerM
MSDSQKWLTLVLMAITAFLLYLLAPILMPFVAGFLLAYLANPVVERLSRWKIPRVAAVFIVFSAITLVLIILVGILIPGIRDQLVYLNTKMPEFIQWINTQAIPWLENNFQIDLRHFDISTLTEALSSSWQEAGSLIGRLISKVAESGMNIVAFLASLALIPVVTFYLMLDWNNLITHISELLPRQIEGRVKALAKECDEVLGAFFRGQLLVMACLSFVYCVGLKIVGLNIAIIVGLIAGVGSFIPYFGFTIGIVLATIGAIFQFQAWLPLLWVWTVFGIGQVIENWVLIPYLVGNKVGLHPVSVIFAVLAGGQLFGFFGMLLAIPAAAVIVVLMRGVRRQYFESQLYK